MRRRTVALGALALLVGGGVAWAVRFDPASLMYLRLTNRSGEDQSLEVRVSADGAVAFETEVDLAAGEDRVFPCSWPSYANTYLIAARTAGGPDWPFARPLDRGSIYHQDLVYTGASDEPWRVETVTPESIDHESVCSVPGWVEDLRGV